MNMFQNRTRSSVDLELGSFDGCTVKSDMPAVTAVVPIEVLT